MKKEYYDMSLDEIKYKFRDKYTFPEVEYLNHNNVKNIEYVIQNWKNIFIDKYVSEREFTLSMHSWFGGDDHFENFNQFKDVNHYRNNCGTCACFGGFLMTDQKIFEKYMAISDYHIDENITLMMQYLFGDKSKLLFYPDWEEDEHGIQMAFYRLCYYYSNGNFLDKSGIFNTTYVLKNCNFALEDAQNA